MQTVLVPALAQFDFTTGNADEENEVYQFIVRKISGSSPLPPLRPVSMHRAENMCHGRCRLHPQVWPRKRTCS